ncbi:hypothetical protein HA514_05780 [Enterobacter kobei]|uniref:hypothetical protein n=1 Tax=Enterobacter kobei TaxID=208224 RepID=UPI00140FF60B|nr:hypothetical protein [Enterobacter kobei]QIP19156.1 hypothetical protein HA514_05780 [Enterobacter kobei]
MNITGKHQGNLVLNENLELTGMVCGDLVVSSGFRADVRGMVTGQIIVENDGVLILNGMVSNGLTNNGGIAEIFGYVKGGVNEISGNTIIHPNAKIV